MQRTVLRDETDLPNSDKAFIRNEKLTEYLLQPTHPIGKSKAKFFNKIASPIANHKDLQQELLWIARNQKVVKIEQTEHGTVYNIDGEIRGAKIKTVWFIKSGSDNPHFVTAYPRKRI